MTYFSFFVEIISCTLTEFWERSSHLPQFPNELSYCSHRCFRQVQMLHEHSILLLLFKTRDICPAYSNLCNHAVPNWGYLPLLLFLACERPKYSPFLIWAGSLELSSSYLQVKFLRDFIRNPSSSPLSYKHIRRRPYVSDLRESGQSVIPAPSAACHLRFFSSDSSHLRQPDRISLAVTSSISLRWGFPPSSRLSSSIISCLSFSLTRTFHHVPSPFSPIVPIRKVPNPDPDSPIPFLLLCHIVELFRFLVLQLTYIPPLLESWKQKGAVKDFFLLPANIKR